MQKPELFNRSQTPPTNTRLKMDLLLAINKVTHTLLKLKKLVRISIQCQVVMVIRLQLENKISQATYSKQSIRGFQAKQA